MQQGSDEWIQARLGRLTASRFHEAVARKKGGWADSRYTYMLELRWERMSRQPFPRFMNDHMRRGTELEPVARAEYARRSKDVVDGVVEVGFIQHPIIEYSGASPDGLVGESGLVEIKCPLPNTHLSTLDGAPPKLAYHLQMQWTMACTGRRWCDFVSFDPNLVDEDGNLTVHALKVIRVDRDNEWIEEMENQAVEFLHELTSQMRKLEGAELEL
jgi:putative phage-type endonuclease